MVLFLFARLVRDSLHADTKLDVIFVLSRALIDKAESLKKILFRLSRLPLHVTDIAADSNVCSSACFLGSVACPVFSLQCVGIF